MKHTTFVTALFTLLVCCGALSAQVKAPKWAGKAKNAVLQITTYDAENKELRKGNAFFVDETGVALSSYSIFKNAHSAKATSSEGIEMPVELIMGANDLYDVIKIRILTSQKKVSFLPLVNKSPNVGEEAILLGFSPEKETNFVIGSIERIAPLAGDSYYTFSMVLPGDQQSSPVLTAKGEVFGLAQPPAANSEEKTYAMAASFINNLSFNALSVTDKQLNAIGIPKDLPQDQEQALAMLYIAGSTSGQEPYFELLSRFISRYPEASEGYQLRAAFYTANYEDTAYLELAEKDLANLLTYAKEKDYAHYHISQIMLNYVVRHDSASYKDWSLQKCLEEVDKAIAINPQPVFYQHAANIYSILKEYEKAYEAYDKVNHSNLASASTFYAASKLKRFMNDTTGIALDLMDSCIARFPQPYGPEAAPYLFERAEMRVFDGQDAAAVADYDAYERATTAKPNALFYYKREQAAMRAKMIDKALEDIHKALSILPNDPTLLEEQGAIYVTIFRYDDAIKSLDAALGKDPNRAYAHRLRGYALLQKDQKEEARIALQRGKELGDELAAQLLAKYFKE